MGADSPPHGYRRRIDRRVGGHMVGVTLLPAATGALVGSVVEISNQGAAFGSIVPSLVVVGALLVADLTAQSLLGPISQGPRGDARQQSHP